MDCAARGVPFTPSKTSQTTIAALEKLAQLTFTETKGAGRRCLSSFNPLTRREEQPPLSDRNDREPAGEEPMVQRARLLRP